MSKRKYPYYSGSTPLKPKGRPPQPVTAKCAHCDATAAYHIVIQTGWFRGDDDEYLVCEQGRQLARDGEWKALYASIERMLASRLAASRSRA